MQRVPELVVHECTAQGEEVTGAKVKKKVKGWSTEEMNAGRYWQKQWT